jgi:hypothetical protein
MFYAFKRWASFEGIGGTAGTGGAAEPSLLSSLQAAIVENSLFPVSPRLESSR